MLLITTTKTAHRNFRKHFLNFLPITDAQLTSLDSEIGLLCVSASQSKDFSGFDSRTTTSLTAWEAIDIHLDRLDGETPQYSKVAIFGVPLKVHTIRKAVKYDVFTRPMVAGLKDFAMSRLLPRYSVFCQLIQKHAGSVVVAEADYDRFVADHEIMVKDLLKPSLPIATGVSNTVATDGLGLAYVDIDSEEYTKLPDYIRCITPSATARQIMLRFSDRNAFYGVAMSPSKYPKVIIPVKGLPKSFVKKADWISNRFYPTVGDRLDRRGVTQLFITPDTFGEMMLGHLRTGDVNTFVDYKTPMHRYSVGSKEKTKAAVVVSKISTRKPVKVTVAKKLDIVQTRVANGNISKDAMFNGAVLPADVAVRLSDEKVAALLDLCKVEAAKIRKESADAAKELRKARHAFRISHHGLFYMGLLAADFLSGAEVPNQHTMMDTLPAMYGKKHLGVASVHKLVTATLRSMFALGVLTITNLADRREKGIHWSPDYALNQNSKNLGVLMAFLSKCHYIVHEADYAGGSKVSPAWQRIFLRDGKLMGYRGHMHAVRLAVSRVAYSEPFQKALDDLMSRFTGVLDSAYVYKQSRALATYVNTDRKKFQSPLGSVSVAEAERSADYYIRLYNVN